MISRSVVVRGQGLAKSVHCYAMLLPVVAVCIWSLGDHVAPVDSAHFMGGLLYWRPVNPAAFDGRVQITHRIALKRTTCSQASATLSASQLVCQSGCSGIIGTSTVRCTDFNMFDNWSAGERKYTYNFTIAEPYFEALYSGGDWIRLVFGSEGNWEFRVRGNLTYREDTGLINSSPVVNIPPLIHLQRGCSRTINISSMGEDPDGDHVRCRWANSSLRECGGVCSAFPANLNERACEIHYNGSNIATGDYAVALQIEDFMSPTDTAPLSSVPVQFVVRVQVSVSSPCTSKPVLVGVTPLNGSYFEVPFNISWNATIIARVSDSSTATSITEFITASPLGMIKSNLIQFGNPGEWQIIVTWTPIESQFGPNIFCFAAIDNIGLQSAQRCVTLFAIACTEPPMILPDSLFPRGKIFSNQSLWLMSVQYDKQFTRPTRDTYIRIFGKEGDEMVSINVKTSAAVTYPSDALGRTLTLSMNICQLPVNHTLYVLLDAGVAVGTDFCHAESPPMTDPTQWTFIIAEHTYNTMQDFFSTKNAETLEFTTYEHTDTQELVTFERTNTHELVTVEHTDTRGQESVTGTAPDGSNTGIETESRNNSTINIILYTCTIVAFVFGVICGLITDRCVCALLKRKAKRQSTILSHTEGSGRTSHYEKDCNEADAVYDEIIPHYYEPGIPGIVRMELNENVTCGRV